ncbi:MAG TPA: histidine kinase [Gemmatimonas aurantiaca]|nr:histidine kinase [Gemmatimonas aurantiaca]
MLAPDAGPGVCWGMSRDLQRAEVWTTGTHAVLSTTVSRRERLLIAAFWLLYAVVTVVNVLFGGRRGPDGTSDAVIFWIAIAEAVGWALATPLLFELVAGHTVEEGDDALTSGELLRFVLIGLGVVGLMTAFGVGLRAALFPPRRGGGGPPIWFAFTNNAVLYGAVIAAGLARAYSLQSRWREQRAVRLEAELARATLATLRQQIDPHFLFNTLNLISSLVDRDPKGVRRMIARLSELLRASLETGGRQEIPLRQELALLNAYLDIMRMRFGARLDITHTVDESLMDVFVPSFLLQPLAENAMRHGIEPLRGAGRVEVQVHRADHELVMQVRDNGNGSLPDDTAPDTPRNTPVSPDEAGGIGLGNTRARLMQLYGPAASLDLRREQGMTVAEVRIPLPAGVA